MPLIRRQRPAREVGASQEVLAQQPVGVLVVLAPPRAAWVAEVDLQTARSAA
jgi:hypothetical protein